MKRARVVVAAAALAVLAWASLSRAQSLPGYDCSDEQEDATPGHYTGSGTVTMTASGTIEMVQVQPIQFRAPYTLDFEVARRPDPPSVTGTFDIQAPVRGTFNSPYGTVRGQRQESSSGRLSGFAVKGRRLTAAGFTLRIGTISCSQIVGTMLTDTGTLAELQGAYRGAGLSVSTESTAFTATLDVRDAALEARVDSWIAQAAATPPLGPATRSQIATTVALGRSIEPPGPPGADPYRSCLARKVLDAAANLAGRRAQAQVARLQQPIDMATRVAMLREAMADLKLAAFLGCEVGGGLEQVFQAWMDLARRLARDGAPAERLAVIAALLGRSAGGDLGPFMEAMNAAATAGGHPPPFAAASP